MPDEVEAAIEQAAQEPKSVTSDGTTVTAHSLKDQIEADRYIESKNAAKKKLGIRLTRAIPPGAV